MLQVHVTVVWIHSAKPPLLNINLHVWRAHPASHKVPAKLNPRFISMGKPSDHSFFGINEFFLNITREKCQLSLTEHEPNFNLTEVQGFLPQAIAHHVTRYISCRANTSEEEYLGDWFSQTCLRFLDISLHQYNFKSLSNVWDISACERWIYPCWHQQLL